jgi:hypothetical protein
LADLTRVPLHIDRLLAITRVREEAKVFDLNPSEAPSQTPWHLTARRDVLTIYWHATGYLNERTFMDLLLLIIIALIILSLAGGAFISPLVFLLLIVVVLLFMGPYRGRRSRL